MSEESRSSPGEAKQKDLSEQLAHVMASSTRVNALAILSDRTASPKEIAAELGVTLNSISHHVKELLRMELIEKVGEERRRGATAHFYRAVVRPILSDAEFETMPLELRRPVSAFTMKLIMIDAARAMHGDLFDARTDRHLSRAPMVVDEEGWSELRDINEKAFLASQKVPERSAQRFGRVEGERIPRVYVNRML